MKRQILALVVFTFISLLYVQDLFAGAWTVPKYKVWGQYYVKWDYAKEEFQANGKKRTLTDGNEARTWEVVMEPSIEYGVTDWFSFLTSMEYKESHYKEYGRPDSWGPFERKNNGISNFKLGGRWRLLENPVVLSVQGKASIYTGYGNNHGDDPAYRNQPSIGKGDDSFEMRALIGKTFKVPLTSKFALPCYAGAETGYRVRTRSVCNDIPYFIEGGFWPVDWFLVKSEIDGYHCHAGTVSIKERYGIWRIGGAWQVFNTSSILRQGNKMFNIEFQYGMVLWGKNTDAFQEWTLKVQTQF